MKKQTPSVHRGTVPLVLLSACVLCAGITALRAGIVSRRLNAGKSAALHPSVDFIQPWLLAGFDDDDYDKYFSDLAAAGYDSVIMQYTRTKAQGICTLYYPSEGMSDYYDVIDDSRKSVLGRLLEQASKHDFKVWVGLSVDDDDWWGVKCYYDDAWMAQLAEVDAMMVREISSLYGSEPAFCGWYWAHELFSNPVGFESKWAPLINTVIDAINEQQDGRPLMLSPFRQIQSGLVTNEYRMWRRFFKQVHFREGDVFAPQDSMGKLNQAHSDHPSKFSYLLIYDYLNQVKRAVDEVPGLSLWVNVELFQKEKSKVEVLRSADQDRVQLQLYNASRVSDRLVTFSYSHYPGALPLPEKASDQP